jgi:hypothetical protein
MRTVCHFPAAYACRRAVAVHGLSGADFEALLNQSFYVNTDRGVVIFDLVDAQEKTRKPKRQFSLTFVGPTEPALPPAMYCLKHRSLGDSDMNLGDAGIDGSARRYRARFTVLR